MKGSRKYALNSRPIKRHLNNTPAVSQSHAPSPSNALQGLPGYALDNGSWASDYAGMPRQGFYFIIQKLLF